MKSNTCLMLLSTALFLAKLVAQVDCDITVAQNSSIFATPKNFNSTQAAFTFVSKTPVFLQTINPAYYLSKSSLTGYNSQTQTVIFWIICGIIIFFYIISIIIMCTVCFLFYRKSPNRYLKQKKYRHDSEINKIFII